MVEWWLILVSSLGLSMQIDPETVKAQYEASKTQFTALSADQQKSVCKQALDALEQAKKAQADAAAAK